MTMNRKQYMVIHHYLGHDQYDAYVRQSHVVLCTDDAHEAISAARKYEREKEVGRYFEDGRVIIESVSGFVGDAHDLFKYLQHGPVYLEPIDRPNHPDYTPF